MKRVIIVVLMVFICVSVIGCEKKKDSNISVNRKVSQNVYVKNTEEFINSISKLGYKARVTMIENKNFLSGALTVVNFHNDDIAVYEYKNNQQMEKDLKSISADGSMMGYAEIDWAKPPHFYKNGNIIVLYAGEDKEIKRVIQKLVGIQFAGE